MSLHLSTFVLVLLASSHAVAHMDLTSPTARYPLSIGDENKACPCGVGGTNRTCDIPVVEQVDNNRNAARVSTFQAGETITLVFDEYIGHAGRWRVAFDPDGAETADFNANILLDVVDPAGATGNAGGSLWNFDVTLPNTPCDNCTLQLVQMMDGNTVDPVPDPTGRSSYYQCADLVLTAPANNPDGGDVGTTADGGDVEPTADGGDVEPVGCAHLNAVPSGWPTSLGAILVIVVFGTRRRRHGPRERRPPS